MMPHSSEKGVSESEIRDAIYVRIHHGDPNLLPHDLPLSEEARSAVVLAREEADKLGHRHVRNEHLVLAVVQRENSHAAKWLGEKRLLLTNFDCR
jgi:ATP-dependent Clp protease ATP-binding subunit ClpA